MEEEKKRQEEEKAEIEERIRNKMEKQQQAANPVDPAGAEESKQ